MDYNVYRLSIKEYLILLVAALAAGGIVSYLFYESLFGLLLAPVFFVLLKKRKIHQEIQKRKITLSEQFMDALKAVSTALLAGYSMENAWIEAQKELELLHGRESLMYQEVDEMNRAVQMNVPLEHKIEEFAIRSGVEAIASFAEIFSFAKRSGGNFVQIIDATTHRMCGKFETEREIEVMVASKKMEQKVMDVIPIGIIAYLKISAMGTLDILYGNFFGVCFMTVCLVLYVGAIYLSERILDIRV